MTATAIEELVEIAGEWQPTGRAVGKAAEHGPAGARAASGEAERRAEARVSFALSGCLQHALAEAVPTVADTRRLWACLRELARSLAPLGRAWRLCPFGSVKNLLLTRGSDVDVAMYRTDAQDEGDAAAAARVLEGGALPLLASSPRFEVVKFVPGARIPILGLRFDGAVDVDLSCHNTEPFRNTQLLRAYAQANPLVRGLVLLVKRWAKAASVSGAQGKNLASYAMTLMTIYFLQVHPVFRLPCLPTHEFDGFDASPECAAGRWECEVSLPRALLRFFAFYAGEFGWGEEVVSVRLGRRCPAGDPEFCQLPNAGHRRLHVEDPFLRGRNLNCVLGLEQEARLRWALRAAEAALRSGCPPLGLGGAEGVAGDMLAL